METLISEDLLSFVSESHEMLNDIANELRHLPSALQVLESSLETESELSFGQQYRSLRQSLLNCVAKTIESLDLLKGVVSLKNNKDRWERIDKELRATEESSAEAETTDKATLYPFLSDFEEELRIRVEGLKSAQEELRMACQDIEHEHQMMLAVCGDRSALTLLTVAGLKLAKGTTLGAFAVSSLVLVLGVTGLSPLCSRLMLDTEIPLRFAFFLFLAIFYRSLSRLCTAIEENGGSARNEYAASMTSVVANISKHAKTNVVEMAMTMESVGQVRQSVSKFFSSTNQEEDEGFEEERAKLMELFKTLQ